MAKKVYLVGGARPNFMKIAPIYKSLKKNSSFFKTKIVHTGQHYDYEMSEIFFKDLGLPKPHIYLNAGSGLHGHQTAKIISSFEKVCLKERPDLVIVVGDVNSTLAVSIVTSKMMIPLAHVEAGLRSFDRSMPEEINRIVTDSLSDFLFTTCKDADKNLRNEGVSRKKIYFVGNVMIDTLKQFLRKSSKSKILNTLNLKKRNYALVTLHRPSNVDQKESFERILLALKTISSDIPVIFPVHPRSRKKIKALGLQKLIDESDIRLIKPVGYLDFLNLMKNSKLVLTDSGGMQEETTVLGIPCITLRFNTERPITVTKGTSTLVGNNTKKIVTAVKAVFNGKYKKGSIPELWDGRASSRIINVLKKK